MARVCFVDHKVEIEVPLGTTILQAAQLVQAPVGAACGGMGACATCHVRVDQGMELLSQKTETEEDTLDRAFDVRPNSRLGCRARIEREGTILVRVTRESIDTYRHEHPVEE